MPNARTYCPSQSLMESEYGVILNRSIPTKKEQRSVNKPDSAKRYEKRKLLVDDW